MALPTTTPTQIAPVAPGPGRARTSKLHKIHCLHHCHPGSLCPFPPCDPLSLIRVATWGCSTVRPSPCSHQPHRPGLHQAQNPRLSQPDFRGSRGGEQQQGPELSLSLHLPPLWPLHSSAPEAEQPLRVRPWPDGVERVSRTRRAPRCGLGGSQAGPPFASLASLPYPHTALQPTRCCCWLPSPHCPLSSPPLPTLQDLPSWPRLGSWQESFLGTFPCTSPCAVATAHMTVPSTDGDSSGGPCCTRAWQRP